MCVRSRILLVSFLSFRTLIVRDDDDAARRGAVRWATRIFYSGFFVYAKIEIFSPCLVWYDENISLISHRLFSRSCALVLRFFFAKSLANSASCSSLAPIIPMCVWRGVAWRSLAWRYNNIFFIFCRCCCFTIFGMHAFDPSMCAVLCCATKKGVARAKERRCEKKKNWRKGISKRKPKWTLIEIEIL